MGLNSSNPINPGVAQPVFTGTTLTSPVPSQAQTNQLRGGAALNSTAAGIPSHVTNVTASVANASKGSTSTVSVTFRRNSADKNFSGVNVFVKGYQGNNSWVQVAGGSDSPVTLVLNNTGEAVSVLVQARGNAGVAPLSTAPTAGIKLPVSSSGGYGNQTSTGGGVTSLTGDVITSGSSSPLTATVVGIETVPVSAITPFPGDTFRYNEFGDSKWDITTGVPNMMRLQYDGSSTASTKTGASQGDSNVGSVSSVAPSSTEQGFGRRVGVSTAGTTTNSCWQYPVSGASVKSLLVATRRISLRLRIGTNTNCRHWIGFSAVDTGTGTSAFCSDTPNTNYAAFRYSAGVDTNWQAMVGTSNAAFTKVDTGKAPDLTNSVLFEIAYNGSAFGFFINGALVATISTNLPASSTQMFVAATADNKNTANATTIDSWYMTITQR